MSWIKEVIVDIIATAIIIAAVFTSNSILMGIVWGYTGLILLAKIVAFWGNGFQNMMEKAQTNAPDWFTHLLYAINTGALLFFSHWYAGSAWAVIWLLSYLTQRKLSKSSA